MVERFQVTREQSKSPGRGTKSGTKLSRGDSHRLDGEDRAHVLLDALRVRGSRRSRQRGTACRARPSSRRRPTSSERRSRASPGRAARRQADEAGSGTQARVSHAAPGVLTRMDPRASPGSRSVDPCFGARPARDREGPSLPRPRPGASPTFVAVFGSTARPSPCRQFKSCAARRSSPPSRRRRPSPCLNTGCDPRTFRNFRARPDPVRSSRGLLRARSVRPSMVGGSG